MYYNCFKGGVRMRYKQLLIDEKRRLFNLIQKQYIELDFSKLTSILECNMYEPRWLEIYILIYKCNLPPDIKAYDILLNKLSSPILKFYFKDGDKRYVCNANESMLSRYVWYLITKDTTEYYMETQYVPKLDYIKEILKFNKFFDSGIQLKNINEEKFIIAPTNYEFDNINDAISLYNKFWDAYDVFRSLKLDTNNFTNNIEQAFVFGKDKRMIATISNILSYFDLKFEIRNDYISMKNTNVRITSEAEADRFQVKLIDAYQFFRNVVNAEDKKDIVSEVYNRRLNPDIRKQFEDNVVSYLKVMRNQELIDWIITISKESKYTLKITFDEQGVFYINDDIITNVADAKEYYIDYMDKKKEKLAMAIYKNNILSRIKNIWNKFRAKFAKSS